MNDYIKSRITVTEKFMGKMKEHGYNETSLAPLVGLSQQNFSHRKRGVVEWRLPEVFHIMDILEIPTSEIADYFKGGTR